MPKNHDFDDYELRVFDTIADQSAERALRGDQPFLFDLGDDFAEYAADLGRREAIARQELLQHMKERAGG
jgi:hypothetical protein